MSVTLRERRRQMLRDEVLNYAQALLAEKGYAAMSMDELAAHVGISKPTLYSHFATKDELVVAAVTREVRNLNELLEGDDSDRTPLERLTFVLREVLQRQSRVQSMGIGPWPDIFRILCSNQAAIEALQQLDENIVSQVRAGIALGEIDRELDAAAVVRAFYGLVSSMPKARLSSLQVTNLEATIGGLVAIFERGVRPA